VVIQAQQNLVTGTRVRQAQTVRARQPGHRVPPVNTTSSTLAMLAATIEGNRAVCGGIGLRLRVTLAAVTGPSRLRMPAMLIVRVKVNIVAGVTAQAVAAARGRALRSLLAAVSVSEPVDVGIKTADGVAAQTEKPDETGPSAAG
jgi:hypothetical protein